MITVAVISQKGGAGKTTLTLHLAVEAAGPKNRPIAILDIDPPGQRHRLGRQQGSRESRRCVLHEGPAVADTGNG